MILHLELVPGQQADAELAGQALIAWTHLLREIGKQISPNEELQVDLLGIAEGSLKLRQAVRWVERGLASISDGADQFPHLKKSAATLGLLALGAGINLMVMPDVQEVRLSDEDRIILEGKDLEIINAPAVQSASEAFFNVVQRDPAISEVAVAETLDAPPIATVPRSQFAERGGLWSLEREEDQSAASSQTITDVWDVVIVKPAAVSKPRAWRFSRDGLEFSALMNDQSFLEAIRDGRVPINLQEGVIMKVRVTYRERLEGQVWQYVPQSRKIVAVLSPQPLPGRATLPFPHDKEERH